MTRRPTAVTVIGWYWRVGGILGMVFALPYAIWGKELYGQYWVEALDQLSVPALFLITFFSSLICLLFGNGILKGRDWARVLCLAFCIVGSLIGALLYVGEPLFWVILIGDLAFTVILGFFLYRPAATAFFRGDVVPGEG
jgi:hypothetical protein